MKSPVKTENIKMFFTNKNGIQKDINTLKSSDKSLNNDSFENDSYKAVVSKLRTKKRANKIN